MRCKYGVDCCCFESLEGFEDFEGFASFDLADYVLGHFSQTERKTMDESCKNSADAIKYMLKGSTDEAMNLYNIKVK